MTDTQHHPLWKQVQAQNRCKPEVEAGEVGAKCLHQQDISARRPLSHVVRSESADFLGSPEPATLLRSHIPLAEVEELMESSSGARPTEWQESTGQQATSGSLRISLNPGPWH